MKLEYRIYLSTPPLVCVSLCTYTLHVMILYVALIWYGAFQIAGDTGTILGSKGHLVHCDSVS